jgi:hypothetical protein
MSAPLSRLGQQARYPASYAGPTAWRRCRTGPGFLSAFAHRRSLLEHPVPARVFRRSHDWPTVAAVTARTLSGFPCSTRDEIRPGWVPSLLRGGGVVPITATWVTGACRFSAASPVPPLGHPIGRGWDYEACEDSLAFTRPVFPLPAVPGRNENGFGFFPGLRTPRLPMTHAKAGTIYFDTGPSHTLTNRASNRCNHSPRATFHVARSPSQWPGTARPSTSAGRSSM